MALLTCEIQQLACGTLGKRMSLVMQTLLLLLRCRGLWGARRYMPMVEKKACLWLRKRHAYGRKKDIAVERNPAMQRPRAPSTVQPRPPEVAHHHSKGFTPNLQ